MLQVFVCAAISATFPAKARSADAMITGAGAFSCGDYLKHREDHASAQIAIDITWVFGFMSGYNMEVSDKPTPAQVTPPTAATTTAFLDKFCRDNPLLTITHAAMVLVDKLGGERVKFRYEK